MKQSYNIISLEVIDFKKIEAASVVFQDGMTKITGENGAGKSSLIDAIFYALKPDDVEKPIHGDANRCVIRLRIGNDDAGYMIERIVTDSGKYLKVLDAAGKNVSSPQTFLNSLFSAMIDPEAFLRMKPKDQCDALRLACNCDTREFDAEHQKVFDERTIVNRRLDQAEKALTDLGGELYPIEPKSASELTNKLEASQGVIKQYDDMVAKGVNLKASMDGKLERYSVIESEIKSLEEKIAKLKEEQVELNARAIVDNNAIITLKAELRPIVPLKQQAEKDIASIKAEMATIDEHNKEANRVANHNERYKALQDSRNKEHGESYALTQKLEEIKREKAILLETADYPVDGMHIEGNNIYVNDVPFHDVNTAERIKIATHVAIAQNPQLKMIVIRNGSMLDDKSMSIIEQVAEEKGYQIIVEKVSSKPEDGSLHIVEGKIQK
jgi:DNA repair exonuclease SbcCD ATPase subunit